MSAFICWIRAAVEVRVNSAASCCPALTYCLSDIWVFKCIILRDKMQSLPTPLDAISTYKSAFLKARLLYQLSRSSVTLSSNIPFFITHPINQWAHSSVQLLLLLSWKRRKQNDSKKVNDGHFVYQSNRHLLIFALLSDNMAAVVVWMLPWFECSKKHINCAWMDGNKWQRDPMFTEEKLWIQELQGCWKLKDSYYPPCQTTPLDSELAYNHKGYTHKWSCDPHTHAYTNAHTHSHSKKAFERLQRVIFFFKSLNLFISILVSE